MCPRGSVGRVTSSETYRIISSTREPMLLTEPKTRLNSNHLVANNSREKALQAIERPPGIVNLCFVMGAFVRANRSIVWPGFHSCRRDPD
jgi:hypothetical protein